MKINVLYSSLSGCTKKVAQAIYEGLAELNDEFGPIEAGIADIAKDNLPQDLDQTDYLAFGYWVNRGGLNADAEACLRKLPVGKIYMFCSLAYYCESNHGAGSLLQGMELAKKLGHEVIGGIVVNGALAPELIERMKQMPPDSSHAYTAAKGVRYKIMGNYPTSTECKLASERFNDRIRIYEGIRSLGPGDK
jgi:flavodoxin